MVDDRNIHHGHASQCHHFSLHHGPGYRRWHATDSALFWITHRNGCHFCDHGADLLPAQGFYCLWVPGIQVWFEDQVAHRFLFSCLTRCFGWHHAVRSFACSVNTFELAYSVHHRLYWVTGDHIRYIRRH